MNDLNICIAGLGNVGSNLIFTISKNKKFINTKVSLSLNILGISAKNKLKKRIFNVNDYEWYDNPLDLIDIKNINVLVELIGEDQVENLDIESVSFIVGIMNDLKTINLRNEILLKVLPLKV